MDGKKLNLESVVPTMAASVSSLILGITLSGRDSLPKCCEQQEYAGESLLAGVEELVDQVLFDPNFASQEIRDEELRELLLSEATFRWHPQ